MISDNTDIGAAFDRIEESVQREYEEVAWEMTADLMTSLSVQVEYIGGYVIRSKPGEAPRREFGDLIRSVDFATSRVNALVRLDVFSTSMISVYLNEGTDRIAPRPHWQPLIDNWRDQLLPRTASAVANVS